MSCKIKSESAMFIFNDSSTSIIKGKNKTNTVVVNGVCN